MAHLTEEDVEQALTDMDARWDDCEELRGYIAPIQDDYDMLLYYAEHTTHCRNRIAAMAEVAYDYLIYTRHPVDWYHQIIRALLDTGLDRYQLSWPTELVEYAITEAGVDVNHHEGLWNRDLHRHLPFLSAHGLNVNLPDHNGETLIHHIVRNGEYFYEMFDLLVSLEADWMAPNVKGQTPLGIAHDHQAYNIHDFLLAIV